MQDTLRHRARRPTSAGFLTGPLAAGALASLGVLLAAAAAHAQTTTLGASDFTVVLSAKNAAGTSHTFSTDELSNLLPAARCSCPITLTAAVQINSASLANVTSSDSFTATVMVGSSCDVANTTTCIQLGAPLTLDANTTSAEESFSSMNLLTAAANGASCSTLTTAISTTVWAIIRQNGVLLASQPMAAVGVGGAGPTPPTAPQATTADTGFRLTWTPPATITSLQGYQVLCSPAPATASTAVFDSCTAATLPAGTAPFVTLDPTLVCSDLVSLGTNKVLVKGLQDGTTYQVAVVSINADGTPSAISDITTVTPQPTLGFDDLYKKDGGTGLVACAVAGTEPRGSGVATVALGAVALLLVARRRRRRPPRALVRPARRARWLRAARRSALGLALVAAVAQSARASDEEDPDRISHGYRFGEEPDKPAWSPSPRNWNFELRFGPYYPAVDSEFADRGSAARPFEQMFTSKQRLLSGLELDRQILHRGGTWSVGFGFGFYRATASSLAADMITRTGDQTSLQFYPLALLAIYRADFLHERYSSPVVPYAKAGLDCAIWSVSNTGKSTSTRGRTFGWNASAGIALDLSFIDPEGMRTMDGETGVNGISLFGEFTYLGLSGFGSSSALRLGDTTWVAGLMMEM
jgi:MYXO-CTERM domain-containing protein